MSTDSHQNISDQVQQPDQAHQEPPSLDVKPEHLSYLRKSIHVLQQKKGEEDNYLLLLEKFIYLTIDFLSKHPKNLLGFDPSEEMILFIEKGNKKAVEAFKEGKYQESAKIVSSVIDLLSQKSIQVMYENQQKLYESKILAYNNLSCVYNAMKKYDLSAKVICSTLKLEEELASTNYGQSELSIISTYFNYSAILSQANQHDKTIPAIEKGFAYMEKMEAKKNLDQNERSHLKNLRISGLFMLGKEYEVLGDINKAKGVLEKAMGIAKELKKQNIIEKVEQALANLKKKE